jgi:hypothetical protein
MKKLLLIIAIAFLIQMGNAQTKSIDYFGQTPPGDEAVIFAPGIISLPNCLEVKIAFSPDGKFLFFSRVPANPISTDPMDIYRVSTSIIDTLKKIAFPKI